MDMDGYILRKLMESKGHGSSDFERFREMMEEEERRYEGGGGSYRRRREGFGDMDEYELRKLFKDMDKSEKEELWESMMGSGNGHFDHMRARREVSEMRHTENGSRHMGEKFPIEKAEEVHRKYKALLPSEVTVEDVYVAINCHYHDFAQLYKAWFGDNIDGKIVESAIVFWFKDEKFPEGDKLWKYFKRMK